MKELSLYFIGIFFLFIFIATLHLWQATDFSFLFTCLLIGEIVISGLFAMNKI